MGLLQIAAVQLPFAVETVIVMKRCVYLVFRGVISF